MKIKYLGTGAYEGVPSPFCDCDICNKSKTLGGRNMRSRSQALVNDDLLIEFNADTVWHYQKYGFDWHKLCGCLITHAHCDHMYVEDMEIASNTYSHKRTILHFYAAGIGYEKIKSMERITAGGLCANPVETGKRFCVGGGKYSVMPMPANHDESSSPVIYSISCENKKLLYAHDTGVFPESTWELIGKEKHFDLVSLDCTGCLALGGDWIDGHMSFGSNIAVVNRMKKCGIIDADTVIVLNYFSHNGGQTYDEMAEAAQKYGFIIAYDGLEVEF